MPAGPAAACGQRHRNVGGVRLRDRESERVSEEATRRVAWDVWVGLLLAPQRSLVAKSSESTPEPPTSAQAAPPTRSGTPNPKPFEVSELKEFCGMSELHGEFRLRGFGL